MAQKLRKLPLLTLSSLTTSRCGARRACSRSAGVSFSSAFQSHVIYKLFIRLACLSISLQATNWLLRHLRMAPEGLFKACPPAACTIARPDLPARLGTPVDLRSTSIRGGPSGPYLSGCARQPFIVRCAHYARGASLTTFGFVTIVPRYLLPQVIPSHSFAALTALVVRRVNGGVALFMHCVNGLADQPMPASASRRATPKGVERAPGCGTLPPRR